MVKCIIKRPIFLDSMAGKTVEHLNKTPMHLLSEARMKDPDYEHICKTFNVNWASPIPLRFIDYVKHKCNCQWEIPAFSLSKHGKK